MNDLSTEAARAAESLLGASSHSEALAWLGLAENGLSEAVVLQALRERLAIVNASEGLSVEVQDELRERLHGSAGEILADVLKRDAVPVARGSVLPTQGQPSPGSSPTAAGVADQRAQLEIAIRHILAGEGGFTPLAVMRLAQLAKLHGIDPDSMTALAKQVVGASSGAPAGRGNSPRHEGPRGGGISITRRTDEGREALRAKPRGEPAPTPEFAAAEVEAERWNRKLRTAIIGGGVGLAALAVGLAVLAMLLAEPPAPTTPATPVNSATGEGGTEIPLAAERADAPRTVAEAPPQTPDLTPESAAAPATDPQGEMATLTWTDLIREVRTSSAEARSDAQQAALRAEPAIQRMGGEWTKAEPGGVVAATTAIVELAYSVAGDVEAARRLVSALSTPPRATLPADDEILRTVFSAGVLSRLAREADLPPPLDAMIRSELRAALGERVSASELAFDSGARTAIARMVSTLIPAGESAGEVPGRAAARWRSWAASVAAIEGPGSPAFEGVLLRALTALIVDAPDPATNRGTYESIGELATTVSWRKGAPARESLLAWMGDLRVAASDLHALTAAVATRSAAEGVDTSMILPLAADLASRANLRERFATVWGIGTETGRAEVFAEWVRVSGPYVDIERDSNPLIALSQAVILARLNAAAAMLWSGESGAVSADITLLDTAAARQVTALDPNMGKIVLVGGGDEAWAVQYLKVGENIPIRRELLAKFTAEPDPLSAAVLVREACRGAPVEVRTAAQELVRRYSTSVPVMNALLDIAPLMPATRDVSDLVRDVTLTQMPSVRSSSWRFAVRRALVERLMQRVAEAGEFAAVETFAASLAGAMEDDPLTRSAAGDVPVPAADSGVAPSEPDEGPVTTTPAPALSAAP